MGRGTARSAVEGQSALESPSTMLRMVPLPMSFAHREERLHPTHPSPTPARRTIPARVIAGTGENPSIGAMTSSAMRGFRRGLLLAATGIIFAGRPAFAQDADDPMPEPQ